MRKVLFVCSRNRWRSKTAEQLFKDRSGLSVRSAGTAASARVRVTRELLKWADTVLVMEPKHATILRQRFGFRTATSLGIPDRYPYMDPTLCALLEERAQTYL